MCIFYVFFLSCVCYAFVRVCLYVPCGHLLGLTSWLSLVVSHWYPGSSVVLDCIVPDLCTLTYFYVVWILSPPQQRLYLYKTSLTFCRPDTLKQLLWQTLTNKMKCHIMRAFHPCLRYLQKRRQRAGINTIKYHTWPETAYGKATQTQ